MQKRISKIPPPGTVCVDTDEPTKSSTGKTADQLIKELASPDPLVRSQAAGMLGQMRSEKAIGPLMKALKDSHVWVRHGAAWALGEIRSRKAVDALKEALNDPDETTRGKAGEALGKIQGS
jgi:HEAT repeat protein